MGLQCIVCVRCPRGGGVHRERRAAFCYGFSMVLAGSTSRLGFFFSSHAGDSSVLLLASAASTRRSTPERAQQHMPELLYPCFGFWAD